MKPLVIVAIFAALCLGILTIVATWSALTPTVPAVAPDTTATPNPDARPK